MYIISFSIELECNIHVCYVILSGDEEKDEDEKARKSARIKE